MTVISPYQPCSTTIQASDSSTAYTQQWYKMEKIGDTEIYVSRNCSCYKCKRGLQPWEKGIAKLASDCQLIDPIIKAHRTII